MTANASRGSVCGFPWTTGVAEMIASQLATGHSIHHPQQSILKPKPRGRLQNRPYFVCLPLGMYGLHTNRQPTRPVDDRSHSEPTEHSTCQVDSNLYQPQTICWSWLIINTTLANFPTPISHYAFSECRPVSTNWTGDLRIEEILQRVLPWIPAIR